MAIKCFLNHLFLIDLTHKNGFQVKSRELYCHSAVCRDIKEYNVVSQVQVLRKHIFINYKNIIKTQTYLANIKVCFNLCTHTGVT